MNTPYIQGKIEDAQRRLIHAVYMRDCARTRLVSYVTLRWNDDTPKRKIHKAMRILELTSVLVYKCQRRLAAERAFANAAAEFRAYKGGATTGKHL